MEAAAAYKLWAPSYQAETAVSALEDRVSRSIMPNLDGRRLLDVGCGIGRRLPAGESGLALAVGVDLVPAMLLAGDAARDRCLVAGDVCALPFADASFDLVWCRLVLGHVEHLREAYHELARVSAPGTQLLVSDFHPAAVGAGHTRSFRDAAGVVREVEHYVHHAADHIEAAGSLGWTASTVVEAPAGEPERDYYARADRLRQLELEADLPLVLGLRFGR